MGYIYSAFAAWIISLLIYVFNITYAFINSSIEKNLVLAKDFHLILFGMAVGITLFGLIGVLRGPCVKNPLVSVPNLPEALKDLKIVQISDLHVGPTVRKDYVEKVVRLTNAINPYLIFITGDFTDANAETIEQHLQPLALLKSRLGIFYITENHEYYWNTETLIDVTKSLGFMPLLNENWIIKIDNEIKILIAGITDSIGGKFLEGHYPDIEKAVAMEENVHFKILLAHRPDVYSEAEKFGFDLQFSGHTHAGQFFPFSLLIPFAHRYYRGLNQHGRMWLYINQGTGYWGPANRFGIRSEITLVKLV